MKTPIQPYGRAGAWSGQLASRAKRADDAFVRGAARLEGLLLEVGDGLSQSALRLLTGTLRGSARTFRYLSGNPDRSETGGHAKPSRATHAALQRSARVLQSAARITEQGGRRIIVSLFGSKSVSTERLDALFRSVGRHVVDSERWGADSLPQVRSIRRNSQVARVLQRQMSSKWVRPRALRERRGSK